MSNHLLPSNSTAEEIALSLAIAPDITPELITSAWDAEKCPLEILPWLAWALHVDDWDENWDESTKRSVVKDSVEIHRRKGTPWAVKRALKNVGYPLTLIETETPYIFDIDVYLPAGADIEASYLKAVKYATGVKNVRSHIGNVSMKSESTADVYLSAISACGLRSEIYPLVIRDAEVELSLQLAAVNHTHIFTEIYPS